MFLCANIYETHHTFIMMPFKLLLIHRKILMNVKPHSVFDDHFNDSFMPVNNFLYVYFCVTITEKLSQFN